VILPTKHINTNHSLLGLGAVILRNIDSPTTVSRIWERLRGSPATGSFGRFLLGLDFLFALGAIELRDGLITKGTPE
jgi:hypothetical protein